MEGVMHWTALHGRALTHTSWGCSSYIPGHELKAVAARHIHPFFRKAMEAVLSCFKMHHSKPVKSNHHCKMVLVWDGVKKHMQGLWKKMRCLNIIQRGTHLWPAVALPEQMTVGQIHLTTWEYISQRFHGFDAVYFRVKFHHSDLYPFPIFGPV